MYNIVNNSKLMIQRNCQEKVHTHSYALWLYLNHFVFIQEEQNVIILTPIFSFNSEEDQRLFITQETEIVGSK